MTTIDIASVCHEINRVYCEGIGDTSQLPWVEAKDWQKTSAINGVLYALENTEATPKDQHEAWYADKLKNGWKYGPEKNAELKEHHCMVPYEELPAAQRLKDHLFRQVVRSLKPFLD